MNRKVLIEVIRQPNDDYAVLRIVMADADRTPLLKLRVHAPELGGQLSWWGDSRSPLVDAEIVAR